MPSESIAISKAEFRRLKRKEALADNLLLQLSKSADDIMHGRVKNWFKRFQ